MGDSEDVLERAKNWVRRFDFRGSYPSDGYDGRDMVNALAAEVRELRRDRARLLERTQDAYERSVRGSPQWFTLRSVLEDFDDAMGGGEGEA